MRNEVDILEEDILKLGDGILELLLQDHSHRNMEHPEIEEPHNIYWATDNYLDNGFSFFDEIQVENLIGSNKNLVQPRAYKSKDEQAKRTKEKAEVFTPTWVVNDQINLIDDAWFGRTHVFNSPESPTTWKPTDRVIFPSADGKIWHHYVNDVRLEITCGEGPYLTSRYDAVSAEPIKDVKMRVGMLDRKLRVIGENVTDTRYWWRHAYNALKSTYGYEWQGDNLLLARSAVLFTVIDHYLDFCDKIKVKPALGKGKMLQNCAYIISWNIFQMDGIKFNLPMSGSKPLQTGKLNFDGATNDVAPSKSIEQESVPVYIAEWSHHHDTPLAIKNIQRFKTNQ